MIARLSLSAHELAAACFPVAGCTVTGYAYAHGAGYRVRIGTPPGFAGPREYTGQGRTCHEALAAAVQLFHDSAHAYPDARPLAAAGSYAPPLAPQPFPADDEPAFQMSAAGPNVVLHYYANPHK